MMKVRTRTWVLLFLLQTTNVNPISLIGFLWQRRWSTFKRPFQWFSDCSFLEGLFHLLLYWTIPLHSTYLRPYITNLTPNPNKRPEKLKVKSERFCSFVDSLSLDSRWRLVLSISNTIRMMTFFSMKIKSLDYFYFFTKVSS